MQKFILIFTFLLFQLLNFTSVKGESIQDLIDDIKDIQDEIKSLGSAGSEEAKIIDQSLEEINKAANFALDKIESEDFDSAKAALAYTDKSIGDVGKVVPKEFESDMSNADIENFAPEKMETLKVITSAMAEKKQEDTNLLLDQIIDLNEAGFDTTSMSGKLASLGIDTVTMIELENRKFDKIKNEIVENQLEISEKQQNLKQLEDQVTPLENQIKSLENQKQVITDKYNADLALQTTQGKELTEQYNKDIERISLEISQSQSEANNINSKIVGLNSEIDGDLNKLNVLAKDVENFNNQLLVNSKLISSKQSEVDNLKSSLPELDKQVEDLNTKKNSLTLKYEQEIAKQAEYSLTPEELEKSKNLTAQINNEIGSISNKINQIETTSSDLNKKISSLSSEIEKNNVAINDLNQRVVNFNSELQQNENLANSKQTELLNLESSLPQLDKQINDLISTKENLTKKYNDELLKQSQINISDEDLVKSKQLSDKFKNDLSKVTSEIANVENETVALNKNINKLKKEIDSNILEVNQISQKMSNLQGNLQESSKIISTSTAELKKLQSSTGNKNLELEKLNDEMNKISLQRDFAIVENEKIVSQEVDDFEQFYHVLTVGYAEDDDQYDREIYNAIAEIDVILSPDPKKHRAFEIDKYGTIAGLSLEEINKGKEAVYNDDWDAQKEILRSIYTNIKSVKRELPISKSVVDFSNVVPNISESFLNVEIAEEKAKDKAIYEVLDVINKQINGPSANERYFASLQDRGNYGHSGPDDYYAKIYKNSNLQIYDQAYVRAFDQEYDKIAEESNLVQKTLAYEEAKEAYENSFDQSAKNFSWDNVIKLQTKASDTYNEMVNLRSNAVNEARALVEAKQRLINEQIELTYNKEIKELTDSVEKTLLSIQTIDKGQISKVKNLINTHKFSIWDDPNYVASKMKAILYDDGSDPDGNMERLFNIIHDNANGIAQVGDIKANLSSRGKNVAAYMETYYKNLNPLASQSEVNDFIAKNTVEYNLSGSYPTSKVLGKVELAAEIQSRQWGTYNTDYDGYNAAKYYTGKKFTAANFSLEDKEKLADEYNKYFPNEKIIQLDNQLSILNDKIENLKKIQTTPIEQIEELKKQIEVAEKNKQNYENQILNFDQELQKKIVNVEKSVETLNNLNNNLTPLNTQLNELKAEKNNLNIKLDEQLTKITKDIEAKSQFDNEMLALKDQYSNEVKILSAKIEKYQTESDNVSSSIQLINSDLKNIGSKNTELENQIKSINEQIDQNQLNINAKQTSLNSLQEQLFPINDQLNSLKSNKTELSNKLNNQIEAIAKEMEEKGRITIEATALKEKYEAELSQLTTKISSIESQSKSTTESINLLTTEIGKIKENEIELKGQISGLNNQITINQNNIDNKKTSLNSLEQKLASSNSEIQTLNNNKKGLSVKLEEQAAKVAKEFETTGEISAENLALKQAYETQLAALNQKINSFEAEAKSINSSMEAINLELNKLDVIQKNTAIKAKELVPDASLTVRFNYENSTISENAAKVGIVSLGKSEEEWSNTWKGDVATTKIIDGNVVNLSAAEIQSAKADLAIQSTMAALSTGEISKDLALDSSDLDIASALSAEVMMSTLQKQSEYLSYAVSEGMHEMTTESAMAGVKSLGKSEAEWAAAWTGEEPGMKNINGVQIALNAEEIQATKAEWAMNRAAQSIMDGNSFSDLSIDSSAIQEATTNATQQAMADVQEKAAKIASQVASTAAAVQNMQQGIAAEVGQDLADTITGVVAANESLASNVAERAIESVEELEDYLNIDVGALTEDTSSWTEADWAASWTGDPATHSMVNGEKVDLTPEEQQKIHAEWAKNRAEQYGN